MDSKKVKFLIADTTAFINNVNLHEYAEDIFTVPDVINEVKNKRQIRRLVVLPFDLIVREPREECVTHVTNFAKQTGDYTSLSAIDMKVIALTYELHKDNEGTDNLRAEPVVSQVIVSKETPEIFIDNTKLAGFYVPKRCSESHSEEELETEKHIDSNNEEQDDEETEDTEKIILEENDKDNDGDRTLEIDLLLNLDKIKLDDELNDILPAEKKPDEKDDSNENEEDYESENSDDDSDWITPSNIQKVKKEIEGKVEDKIPAVACMTTDYALQNVLKQINLNICALDGRLIKQLRTYILRCYACFKTTSIMTKLFCPNCGNKTLKRVAVSLDENGKQVIHINTRRPLTAKYKNQSLPRPKGGKHSRNPIVVEDQPIPKQMPSRVAKSKTQALQEDYVAGYSPFSTRDLNSKSALLRSKGHVKEWARNNLFEEERRKRRFNRLVK